MKFKSLKLMSLITLTTLVMITTQPHAQLTHSKKQSTVEVIFETTMGAFTLELNPEKAPQTVANFLVYVDEGFYSNTLFHRVIPRFVAQAGGFKKGLKKKKTHSPVINESDNGLLNTRGTISMARSNNPDSATSQFFINLAHNPGLDQQQRKPGYTVFGKVTEGMNIIDNIVNQPTTALGPYNDLQKEDIVILSAKRKSLTDALANETKTGSLRQIQNQFIAGEHYIELEKPVPTRDNNKIEVVEMFSYGCPHCYEFEPLIREWAKKQDSDIDFWYFPAVWNKPMKVFAQAFYAADELKVLDQIHLPLFSAIAIDQKKLSSASDLANFLAEHGVDKKAFALAFKSTTVESLTKQAEARVNSYTPMGVPEIIVNGKYRIDRMRAGGMSEMLAVVDFLINKERAMLENS